MFLHIIIMQSSFHIKHLDLSHNEFGEESGEILGPALGNTIYTCIYAWFCTAFMKRYYSVFNDYPFLMTS